MLQCTTGDKYWTAPREKYILFSLSSFKIKWLYVTPMDHKDAGPVSREPRKEKYLASDRVVLV